MKSVTVLVATAPKNRNKSDGRHWGTGSRERKRIFEEVRYQILAQGCPKLRTPVRLDAVRRGHNRMDPGGLMEAIKRVLDALVRCNVIPDDNSRCVPLPWHGEQQILRDPRRPGYSELALTLTEMEEEHGNSNAGSETQ